VKYQDQDESNTDYTNGSFSSLALERWLQVTLPLTALTLLVAWSTYKMYDTSRDGMTSIERIKDMYKNMKSLLIASEPTQALEQSLADGGQSYDDKSTSRSGRHLARIFKPARTLPGWTPKNDPPLPLHEIGVSQHSV
jgi:hypothetical protein